MLAAVSKPRVRLLRGEWTTDPRIAFLAGYAEGMHVGWERAYQELERREEETRQ